MNYFALSALINAFTSSTIGIFILKKNPKSIKNRTLFYYSLGVFCWSLSYFLWQISISKTDAIFWSKALMLFAIFIPSTMFHLSTALLDSFNEYKSQIFISYFISIIFGIISILTNHIVLSVEEKSIFNFWPTPGMIFIPFLGFFFSAVIYAHILMFKHYPKLTSNERNKIKYVFLGTALAFTGGSTNYFLWFDIPILPYGNFLIPIYAILVSYSIIKYRLMDIRLAFTKIGIFFAVYTLVLGVPILLSYRYDKDHEALWLMLVLATAGPYIYTYLQKQAENKLLKEQIIYQRTLRSAAYALGRVKQLKTLIKLIERIIKQSVGIQQSAIYLIDDPKAPDNTLYHMTYKNNEFPSQVTIDLTIQNTLIKQSEPFILEELNIKPTQTQRKELLFFLKPFQSEIIIPIVQSNKLLALILLGRKRNGILYSNEDLTVFAILASQAGLAIENCLFIEKEEERLKHEGAQARRESLDMMVSTMAHEIDNPIQGAIGQAEMLKICLDFFKDHLPQETMQEVTSYCEKIDFHCRRVSAIVRAVEGYSKRETGLYKAITLDEVIIPYHSLLPMIQKKYINVQYSESIQRNLPQVWAEEIMIEEILMNLVENAYHAVIHNQDEMNVSLAISQKNADYIHIEVKDNGYGIAPKIKKQLFEVPTTTKGSSEGTGIGLYRIRQICEVLNAHYGAESDGKNKGSIFYVDIPIYHPPIENSN